MLHAFAPPLLAFAVATAAVALLVHSRLSSIVLDRPNDRSLHDRPVSRAGGLGIHAGIMVASLLIAVDIPAVVWLGAAGLLLVSLIDDVRGSTVAVRLVVQLLASVIVAAFLLPNQGWFVIGIATLGIVWMTNLYNFMDGTDGLAGGMAVFGFGYYAAAAWQAGHASFAMLNLSVAAAALGFLLFNFPPARIFMGDVGSIPLGFLAASFGLIGWVQQDWPWWFPLLVFSSFGVDASVTLLRRLYSGSAIWHAHRDHYYQRLVQLGWGHRRTAYVEYMLMLLCGLGALAALRWSFAGQLALLASAAFAYSLIIIAIEITWRKHLKKNNVP